MKIVYDHQIFAMQEYGGISRYFVELTSQLAMRSDVQLDLLAPLHFNRYVNDLNPKMTHGLRIPKFPMAGTPTRWINNIISRAWLKQHQPEIIHATYYYPFKKPANNKAKYVVTVHDMIYEMFPQDFPASDRTAQLKQSAVMHADHVICDSKKTREDLVRLTGVDPQKVSVVHLGVNLLGGQPDPGLQLPDAPYLLYVGIRGGYKNFNTLLKAYAVSAALNSNMLLVCFGGGGFSAKEQATHKRLGLGNGQIQWFGGSDAVLASLYRGATAFVYPSRYEGFGMPPLEAMSLGCPVVCSNTGSVPEIVGDAGEYFDPDSADQLIQSITRVATSQSHADELRQKGNLRIRDFSWQKCAEKTFSIYKSLLQDNPTDST